MKTNIGVVIVTYNRLNKLKTALMKYDQQLLLPDYIIVVDNASTDDTRKYLSEWEKETKSPYQRIVLTASENRGGSGGFYLGEEAALRMDSKWVMIGDDDAYPESDYLQGIMDYINKGNEDDLSIVCGKVIQNGTLNHLHRCVIDGRYKWNFFKAEKRISFKSDTEKVLDIDLVSYVGIAINCAKMEKVGLVNKDYFIWQDDYEHSLRLRKVGRIVCLPQYNIIHETDKEHIEFSWKTYYEWRNGIDMRKKHFSSIHFFFMMLNGIMRIFLSPLKGHGLEEIGVRLRGVRDGLNGCSGKHVLYSPGWIPKSNRTERV